MVFQHFFFCNTSDAARTTRVPLYTIYVSLFIVSKIYTYTYTVGTSVWRIHDFVSLSWRFISPTATMLSFSLSRVLYELTFLGRKSTRANFRITSIYKLYMLSLLYGGVFVPINCGVFGEYTDTTFTRHIYRDTDVLYTRSYREMVIVG